MTFIFQTTQPHQGSFLMMDPQLPVRVKVSSHESELASFIETLARWCAATDLRATVSTPRRSRWAIFQENQDKHKRDRTK